MYEMTLDQFLDYKNFIDIQNTYEDAMYQDQEVQRERDKKAKKHGK